MKSLSADDLRQVLSSHLAAVRRGESLLVTDHGQVVARILLAMSGEDPITPDLAGLLADGRASLSGHALAFPAAGVRPCGSGPMLSDVVRKGRI